MPLAKQKINISFAQGVDTKSDPKQVIPGRLLVLENAVFQKTNSLIKRNGYTKLSQGTLTGGIGLSTFKDQLFMLSGQTGTTRPAGRTYSPSTSQWSDIKGYYQPVNVQKVSTNSISSYSAISNYPMIDSCVDTTTNTQLILYTKKISATQEAIMYSVLDLNTNTLITQDQLVPTLPNKTTYARVVKFKTYFAIIFSGVSGGVDSLVYVLVDPISPQSSSLVSNAIVAAGTSAGQYRINYPFDAYADNSYLYVAYPDGSTFDLSLRTVNTSYTVSATTLVAGMNAQSGCTIVPDASGNLFFATCSTSTPNVKLVSYTAGLASQRFTPFTVQSGLSGPNTIVGAIDPLDPTQIYLYWNVPGVFGAAATPIVYVYYALVKFTSGTPSIIKGPSTYITSASIYGKPYTYDNSIKLLLICTDGFNTQSYFIFDGIYYYCDAKLCTYSAVTLRGNPVGVSVPSANTYQFAMAEVDDDSKGFIVNSYKITYDHKPVFGEIGNNLHITGGFLYMFDGQNLAEQNFLQQPNVCYLTDYAAGNIAAGTYYYKITYEWIDAYGQLHISSPSGAPTPVTIAANRTIRLAFANLAITNRLDNTGGNKIYIGVYRSSDGINYYKNKYTGINNLQNSVTSGYVLYDDSYSFADAYNGQPLLYTSGGVVPNCNPGATSYVATYNQRLIAIPSENTNTWWYSQEIVPGSPGNAGSPVYFSDEFISSIDERFGGIIAVQQMDEKLVFFKRNNIFALSGNGPSPNNTGNDFNPPQVIATDTGCNENQSVILGPSGIMFKSAKGYYLIDRSMSVSYIGAPVEAYNSYTVQSADIIYNLNQFRFGLSNGQALVYNYLFDQWSIFTNHAISEACIYQNKFTYMKTDASVYQENSGYTDNGSAYALKLQTSWLSFADLNGFQRVYKLMLLGKYKSSHGLQVQVCHDFNETINQTTNVSVLATDPYQYRIFLNRQKCTSIRFTITDTVISGEGYEISSMAFEVGVKQGLNKLAANRSFG